jgi:hypothetical protein
MKKLSIAVVSLLALLGVLLAVPAFSSPSGKNTNVPRQVRQLQSKMRALQSRVALLEKAVGGIKSCESTVQALGRYPGYVWTPDGGTTYYTTTAVDVPDAGEAVGVYVSVVNPSCVGSGSAMYSLAKPGTPGQRRHANGAQLHGLVVPDGVRTTNRTSAKLSQLPRRR